MIDHETAREAFATSLDFALEPDERDALDTHLGDCVACRAFVAAVRSDAAVLREFDLGPVPIAVRANLAIAAEHTGRSGIVGRWIGIAVVGAILIAAIGGGALGIGGSGRQAGNVPWTTTEPDAANLQITWKTEVALLTATAFSIDVGGKTFRAATPKVDVRSDVGDSKFRTLEATWMENGVEMRLSLSFANDATSWWVDQVRIYNGADNGKWLYAKGPLFRAPIGASWTGNQDIAMTDTDGVGGEPARVRFAGLTLATHEVDVVQKPIVGPIKRPVDANPFAVGQVLHCSGILQMDPIQAQATLLAMGYPISWRHLINNGSYADPLKEPPPGTVIVDGPAVGSEGEILIAVVDANDPAAVPVPFPADCPRSDPDLTPPPPAR